MAFLIFGILSIVFDEKITIKHRLDNLKQINSKENLLADDEMQKSFLERVVKPVLRWLSGITEKLVPINKREFLEKRLIMAGNPWNLSPNEFITLNYFIIIIFGAAGFAAMYFTDGNRLNQILVTLGGSIFGRLLMENILKSKIKGRQNAISKELPDVLDLLTVSVEAGLGFDASIQKVVNKMKGPISQEFKKTLQEIKIGKQRKDALRDLADRTGDEDLNTFVGAIIQADQLGVSIGKVLRIQSKQMRLIRKQRIEEKAMKAPIKMLIPMVLFIFPALFLVLLGPAVLQFLENF
jgi:tight adherence protein C